MKTKTKTQTQLICQFGQSINALVTSKLIPPEIFNANSTMSAASAMVYLRLPNMSALYRFIYKNRVASSKIRGRLFFTKKSLDLYLKQSQIKSQKFLN
jgi:hypothetical protein